MLFLFRFCTFQCAKKSKFIINYELKDILYVSMSWYSSVVGLPMMRASINSEKRVVSVSLYMKFPC